MKMSDLIPALLPFVFFYAATTSGSDASGGLAAIDSLKTKNKFVAIHSGEHCLSYTVKTLDREPLAQQLSPGMLSRYFPGLGKIV